MEPVKIPHVSELPESVDPMDHIRRKVAKGIRRACTSTKFAKIAFPPNDLYSTMTSETMDDEWGKPVMRYERNKWNMDLFKKAGQECMDFGYSAVILENHFEKIRLGKYGTNRLIHLVVQVMWDPSNAPRTGVYERNQECDYQHAD